MKKEIIFIENLMDFISTHINGYVVYLTRQKVHYNTIWTDFFGTYSTTLIIILI